MFHDRLNEYITRLGCSGRELAEASGLSPATISRYRGGERRPESEAERVSELLKYEMEHAAQLSVPLTVDVKTGKSWAEAH